MGTIQHHAIIVTSLDKDKLADAREKSMNFGNQTTDIFKSPINVFWSFIVLPDGSYEERAESDDGDKARMALIDWIGSHVDEDGGNHLTYVEVSFGEITMSISGNAG